MAMLLFRRTAGTGVWLGTYCKKFAKASSVQQVSPCCQRIIARTLFRASPSNGSNCYGEKEKTDISRLVRPLGYSMNNFSTSSGHFGVTVGHTISSRLSADRLIREMTDKERDFLEQALNDLKQELDLENEEVGEVKPTSRQLWLMALNNSIPFVGFGFLDNAIMIAAGEYIDLTVGATLGITTMAAAGIGNMISDVFGIGLAGYVEVLASRLGIPEANLSAAQLNMKSTRIASYGGRAAGIIIGCFIGMFPLLLIEDHKEKDGEQENVVPA